jgi:hypothetical protein
MEVKWDVLAGGATYLAGDVCGRFRIASSLLY